MSNVKIFKQQTNKQAKQDRKSETQKNLCPSSQTRLSYMRISKKQSQAREGKNQITGSNRMGEYFNNKHGSKEKHTTDHQHQDKNLCPSSQTGDSGRGRRKAPLMRSRTGTF